MAVVKCALCGKREDKSLYVQDENKKYYHFNLCHVAYLKDREFKRKEREAKLQLSHKIAEVYELQSYKLIPSTFYPYIEDVRNDSTLFGKLGKQYKAGIPYEGIAYTYDYCKEQIREAKKRVPFKNFMAELRYGLAIVKNSLVDAKKHAIQQKRKDQIMRITIDSEEEQEKYIAAYESLTNRVIKKDDLDISDML